MADKKKENVAVKDAKKDVKKSEKKARRFHPIKRIKDTIAELKKVTWPSRKDLVRHSGVVIIFVVLITAVIALYDFILTSLMRLVI